MPERFSREGIEKTAAALRQASGGQITQEQAVQRVVKACNQDDRYRREDGSR